MKNLTKKSKAIFYDLDLAQAADLSCPGCSISTVINNEHEKAKLYELDLAQAADLSCPGCSITPVISD